MANLNITLPDRATPTPSTPRANPDITPTPSRYRSLSFLAMRPHSKGDYFTRDSQATLLQPDNSLRIVRPSLIRYDGQRFLIEPGATNYFTQPYTILDERALSNGDPNSSIYVTQSGYYVTDGSGNYVTVKPSAPTSQDITLQPGTYLLMVIGIACTATLAFLTATGQFINQGDGVAIDECIDPFRADLSLTDQDLVGGCAYLIFAVATAGTVRVAISDYNPTDDVWVQLISGCNPHTMIPNSAASTPTTCAPEYLTLNLAELSEIYRGVTYA